MRAVDPHSSHERRFSRTADNVVSPGAGTEVSAVPILSCLWGQSTNLTWLCGVVCVFLFGGGLVVAPAVAPRFLGGNVASP